MKSYSLDSLAVFRVEKNAMESWRNADVTKTMFPKAVFAGRSFTASMKNAMLTERSTDAWMPQTTRVDMRIPKMTP